MALRAVAASASFVCMLTCAAAPARAQSVTTEAAVVSGYSTDDLNAQAVQLRAFGDLAGGVRYFGELAWARSSRTDDDAFAAAYPYGNRVDVIEAYGERIFRPGEALLAVRGGRFRPPFGIYAASDHAYGGFLRPPLIRYSEYSGISNHFLEQGADVTVGVPWLTVESALGAPGDVGDETRGSGLDSITRVQAYYGPFIAGASYIRTSPIQTPTPRAGKTRFGGVDLRWAHGGVQARGEWVSGAPFDGASAHGWYVDGIVHVLGMGPVTAVARIERLAWDDPTEHEIATTNRQTAGARVRLPLGFAITANLVHRTGHLGVYQPSSLDVGVLWSGRHATP
jgi:hypothetical protein